MEAESDHGTTGQRDDWTTCKCHSSLLTHALLALASIDLVLSVSPLKYCGFCAEARGKTSALSLQFRNRRAAGKNQVGPPGKIGNGDLPGVNAEVAVNRRQKIAGRAHP